MELAEQGQSVAVRTSARTPFIHPAVHADGETAAPPRRPRAGMFDAIADLERFAHKVSHDLGGPLHSMRMLTELIQARLDEGDVPQAREWVSMIGEHSQRLGRLVGAMSELLLTAGAVPQLQRVALGDLVAAVRREQPAPPEAVVRVASLPTLCVDPVLMTQVFARLLDNAYKFSSRVPRPRIDLRCENLGRHWRFQVRDNGCGFAASRTDELFRPFARLHGHGHEGAGISLAVVRRIVELHGGQVWADGAEGRGATFSFTLPG